MQMLNMQMQNRQHMWHAKNTPTHQMFHNIQMQMQNMPKISRHPLIMGSDVPERENRKCKIRTKNTPNLTTGQIF